MEDVKQATHLPSPSDVGGDKFAAELTVFCREFRPTTSEIRRLLMVKMGTNQAKVSGYPENDVHLINPEWDHIDNGPYRVVITDLCGRRRNGFPVRMDMCKISACRQEDGESVSQYLAYLTEVHDTHSGLTCPANLNDNAVTPCEAHLRNTFHEWHTDISSMVKRTCITLNSLKHMLYMLRKLLGKARGRKEKRIFTWLR